MSTVTPSRATPVRGAGSRTRPIATHVKAASIDPFRVLRRYVLELFAAGVFGAGLGVVAYFLLSAFYPLYTSEVLFEIQPSLSEAGDVAAKKELRDEEVYRVGKTELVLMASREVLTAAVGDPDVQSKTEWFRRNFVDEAGSPLVAEAVDELEEDVKTLVMRGTELFQVSWSAHKQSDVPIVLNAIQRAYMDKRKALDNAVYNDNLEIFNRQLSQTNLAIKDLDQEIEAYIIDADITSLEDPRFHENAIALRQIVAQIGEAQHGLSVARSGQLQTAAKLEGTLEPNASDIQEAEMDFAVASHIRVEEQLKFEIRALRDKFREDHPTALELESRLRAATAEKKAKTDEIIARNLESRLKGQSNAIEIYSKMLEELEVEGEAKGDMLSELAAQQSSYDALKNQRDLLEEQRSADQQLIKAIQLMRLRADAERVAVAQTAQTPRHKSFPKPEIIVPLGILLVLGLTVGIIFLREILDERIKSASDLAVLPGAHLLGVVPDLQEDPTKCEAAELVLQKFPTSVLAESYRLVCAPLTKAMDRAGHQTLVIMGGLPGAGSSTVASNLAAGCAATGRNVLIVDANFRRPRLADIMGLDDDQPGLGDALTGKAAPDDVVTETEGGLRVLTAGTPATRIIDRLNSERFDSIVAEMRGRFDTIIFDAPPAVVAGDAMVLANKLDAAVLVVRANQEQRGLVARVIRQLTDTQCELLGVVLNRPLNTAGGYFKKNFATMAEYATTSTK